MSITDELREWIDGNTVIHVTALRAIADRIDAEHESACAEAYGNGVQSVALPDMTAYVKLPVDADGVPIRVGERVQLIGNDPSTVSHMSLADDGWRVYVKYDGGIGTGSGEPKRIRHHHEPTVEGVLRDFGVDIAHALDADPDATVPEAIIAEYAAKLRLAGEDE